MKKSDPKDKKDLLKAREHMKFVGKIFQSNNIVSNHVESIQDAILSKLRTIKIRDRLYEDSKDYQR